MKTNHQINRSTRLTTAVVGTALAVAGFHHGFFESLQGNAPTSGVFINSIGPSHIRWEFGTDPAFTVIPNFLMTGLASMIVSAVIVAWCFWGLRRSHGSSVLLALFVLLTLVGGGVGHIPFFVIVWAYSTRMRKPLTRVTRLVPHSVQQGLAAKWLGLAVGASLLFLVGLEVSVFGLGTFVTDSDRLLWIDWAILLASLLGINVAYLSAMLRDAELRATARANVLPGIP